MADAPDPPTGSSTPTAGRARRPPRPRPAAAPKEPIERTVEGTPVAARPPPRARPSPPPIRRPAASAKVPAGTIVDATGLVLGRAASRIAQRLLAGESIVVVNAEKSVVTGSRKNVLSFYVANRARGSKRSGPHYPRYPDRIFRRTVRGMLPHLKTRGQVAFDRLTVYIGVPSEYSGAPRGSIEDAKARPALRAPMTLEEITRLLGARV
ncbi:MAG TPA: 50S ribosomal protein L13 [Thermoplasmata archaeon]|nr:50S ribosomal protein L13 [Thermoplasmata archaeon]